MHRLHTLPKEIEILFLACFGYAYRKVKAHISSPLPPDKKIQKDKDRDYEAYAENPLIHSKTER
jgi:hypothetical protein